ncbi:glycosyltransferase family 4 protein [Pararhodobacter sp. SW119]|uniref:glycosyltransferase family 4 protein n=1 Tax=Pararhodobacter sp. SW119 TaxID=2780075 RepID=UPI001ADFF950|nr:glycosyltransferase family 4 protein [Pararhodobacter sp. SW119]
MRILIVTPNASFRSGGEAVLPLKYFTFLRARGHDVRLIAHSRNRSELAAALPDAEPYIHYVEDTALHVAVWRMGIRFPSGIRDHLFGNILLLVNEWHQRRLIRLLVAKQLVDLIHQPIPVSPTAPSMVYGMGVPVVIGPMNGGMSFPPGYEDYEGPGTRTFIRLARALSGIASRLVPGKRQAAVLLVANARTRSVLPVAHSRVIELVENGVDFSTWTAPAQVAKRPGFRLVFLGRLVALKALDITLDALALARTERSDLDITLDILGDGPERSRLEALDQPGVAFHGFRPQTECAEILASSHALILNSLRECGGAVVLEAMAMGLPVIASDWGGPSDYLTSQCGVLVHPTPRDTFAQRLARAILDLAQDPERAAAMGRNGAARVRSGFDWQSKVNRMEDIFTTVIEDS